jgi:predicted metal-dependent enzyme (double-stranded beta helix superfamily)
MPSVLADSTFARRCHLPLEGMFAMFDKDRFIEDCRAAAKETQPGLAVKELIARAVSDPRDVARAFGEPQAGLVDVLYRGDDINVLHVAWAPLMTLLPHDHLMWVAIGIYGGREENVFYRRGENGLIQLRGMQLETRDAALFGATAIHSAANPLDRVTGTIHVYGGDFIGSATARHEWDPESLQERAFDREAALRAFDEANQRFANHVTIW